jgi:transposase
VPIVGGLYIHRKQITFDYPGTETGQVRRGQVSPADRVHLRAWLARFAGREDVAFAVEACTGWRYVAGELALAGVAVHLAEPADTAFARGRKRHAKTGKAGSRHLRQLLAGERLPECRIPPGRILECRALLETCHDLRAGHTPWVQRIHAVLFRQGAPAPGEGTLRTGQGRAALRAAAAGCLSPAGQLQVAAALDMTGALKARLHELRHQLLGAARHLAGAKVLAARLYGVGPVTALAMTCWLAGAGRFSSARKAVRFAGLDVTVWSPDRKGPPGRLSRRDHRCCAGRSMRPARRTPGPRPRTAATTPRSRTGRAASAPRCPRPARSSGRPITSWPGSAATRSPPWPELSFAMVTSP